MPEKFNNLHLSIQKFKTLTLSLEGTVSQYLVGNVQVIWLDDTSAFVVLHKKDQAEHGNYIS